MGARALTLTRIDMDEALVSRQIHLLYQPIFSLADGSLARVEALVRWDHPRFGTMLPAVFLPAFEAQDRLTALTRRIIERAAAEFSSWSLKEPAALSINLAARDCEDPSLPDSVRSVLEATKIDPQKIVFECPIKLGEPSEASRVLLALKGLGVRLAAELMGRAENLDQVFAIAPFDEVKTGGRGLLRAARNNHLGTLESAANLIERSEERGAKVTAIGAENEAACQALRHLGFHQVQANVLSSAVGIDDITPKVVQSARVVLGLELPDGTAISQDKLDAQPDEFRSLRKKIQGEAFKRAAQRKEEINAEDQDAIRGAKAIQNVLAESYGDEPENLAQSEGLDVRAQQEALMDSESKAGLLMRTDLASASLGYGASPLRPARKEKAAVIVVEPSEAKARALAREPEVAQAITEVLNALPAFVAERQGHWDEDSDDAKADRLDAEVAKAPQIDPDTADHVAPPPAMEEDLLDLATRLRPEEPARPNFLTKKYKLKVTHFWPRPWRRAYDRFQAARQSAAEEQEVFNRLSRVGSEQDPVSVMPLGPENASMNTVASDQRSVTGDEGTASIKD